MTDRHLVPTQLAIGTDTAGMVLVGFSVDRALTTYAMAIPNARKLLAELPLAIHTAEQEQQPGRKY